MNRQTSIKYCDCIRDIFSDCSELEKELFKINYNNNNLFDNKKLIGCYESEINKSCSRYFRNILCPDIWINFP